MWEISFRHAFDTKTKPFWHVSETLWVFLGQISKTNDNISHTMRTCDLNIFTMQRLILWNYFDALRLDDRFVPHTTLRMMKIKKRKSPTQIPVKIQCWNIERDQIRITTHSQVVWANVKTVLDIKFISFEKRKNNRFSTYLFYLYISIHKFSITLLAWTLVFAESIISVFSFDDRIGCLFEQFM